MVSPNRYHIYNRDTLLIEWPISKNLETLQSILFYQESIQETISSSITEMVPAYHSLLIGFDYHQLTHEALIAIIKEIQSPKVYEIESTHWKIPVNYNAQTGIDLESLSSKLVLSIEQIISLHTKPTYRVHFLGFLPGFVYLSGLDPLLDVPRRDTPRIRIPAGSVAIAAGQTGIYPTESPGGWHIIGHTNFDIFNPENTSPCPFKSGDTLQFYQIHKV